MRARPDLVLLSLGTTRGLRVADATFLEQSRRAGAAAEVVAVRIGALDRLRRGYPVNDLVEAAAARRALRAVLERRPRAVVFSSVTPTLLAPPLDVPYAVRFDSPAVLNRPGLRNRLLHVLERRRLADARLLLPMSHAAVDALPPGAAPSVVLPPSVVPSGPPGDSRERLAVAYVPDPKAKGLDVLCGAWSEAAPEGARLEVFGIERERGLRHLARTGVREPDALTWRGPVPAGEFRAALRRCTVFVGSARWEDFGQAPLEALADGALVATVPSGGAFEALRIARELAPDLVAEAISSGALARSVRAAFAMDEQRARAYRAEAAKRLAGYRPEALVRTLAERVLPALLG